MVLLGAWGGLALSGIVALGDVNDAFTVFLPVSVMLPAHDIICYVYVKEPHNFEDVFSKAVFDKLRDLKETSECGLWKSETETCT